MKYYYGKNVLVTGASSGIGKSISNYLADKGYSVIGVSRNVIEETITVGSGSIRYLKMDVTDESSILRVVNIIKDIDILVLSHGMGIAGAAETMPTDLIKKQMDVNYYGSINVCRYFLPLMRNKNKGLVISISSIAGIVPIPMQSHYSSSKYALEAYIESLGIEMKYYNIKTCLVEPGDTKTGFTSARNIYNPNDSIYHDVCEASINKMAKDEQNGKDPITVAKVVYKVIRKKNPPIRVAVGFDYKLLSFLIKLLPSRLTNYILSKLYMPKIKK